MATPNYPGTAQPAPSGGWLSGLGSWFGGPAPVYAGAGQSASSSSGYLGGATPAYKPAPSQGGTATASGTPSCEPERITLMIPRELIEPQQ
jgi:hypothetical protein